MAVHPPSLRDPHCGNLVDPHHAIQFEDHGVIHYFCSEACLRDYRYERS